MDDKKVNFINATPKAIGAIFAPIEKEVVKIEKELLKMGFNFFHWIKEGFIWIGKETEKAVVWLPKLVSKIGKVDATIQQDLPTFIEQTGVLIDDGAKIAAAATMEGGIVIERLLAFGDAVAMAVAQKALNIASDQAVITSFENLIGAITSNSAFGDLLKYVQQFTIDYEKLGVTIKADLEALKADVEGTATPTTSTTPAS